MTRNRVNFRLFTASVEQKILDTNETVKAYKQLSLVEQAFRSLKTVDLKIRPIYHYLAGRVKAHVFLCMHCEEDDQPVHSFQTLLDDLATITRNTVEINSERFDKITVPTALQQKALKLLKVRL